MIRKYKKPYLVEVENITETTREVINKGTYATYSGAVKKYRKWIKEYPMAVVNIFKKIGPGCFEALPKPNPR